MKLYTKPRQVFLIVTDKLPLTVIDKSLVTVTSRQVFLIIIDKLPLAVTDKSPIIVKIPTRVEAHCLTLEVSAHKGK